MKIKKIVTNSVAIVDDEKNESVVMGKGITFGKKVGDDIPKDQIQKIFVLKQAGIAERFSDVIRNMPMEYIKVCDEIINYAKKALNNPLSDIIYLTLTDHIAFALKRTKEGTTLKNSILWEIKNYYKQEFEIGLNALKIIENRLNVSLPEDEAAFIALHIINALTNQTSEIRTPQAIQMMQDILTFIKYSLNIEFDEESIYYQRFITHIKFFTQRLVMKKTMPLDDSEFYAYFKVKYVEISTQVEKIALFIRDQYGYSVSEEEKGYLIVHLKMILMSED